MMELMRKHLRIKDVFYENFSDIFNGFITPIESYFPGWEYSDITDAFEEDVEWNHADRLIAPIVYKIKERVEAEEEVVAERLTHNQRLALGKQINRHFKTKWDHYKELWEMEYDPLHNYLDEYTSEREAEGSKTGGDQSTYSGSDETTTSYGKEVSREVTGVEEVSSSNTETRNLSDSGSEVSELTYGKTDTKTLNTNEAHTGTETTDYGKTDTKTLNTGEAHTGTETTEYGKTETETLNLIDEETTNDDVTYGKTETTTFNTTVERDDSTTTAYGKTESKDIDYQINYGGRDVKTDTEVHEHDDDETVNSKNATWLAGYNSSGGTISTGGNFADRSEGQEEHTGSKKIDKVTSGTVENYHSGADYSDTGEDTTYGGSDVVTLDGEESKTGTETLAGSGTDQRDIEKRLEKTGTDTKALSGEDEVIYNTNIAKTGTETDATSGEDEITYDTAIEKTGTETNASTGTDEEEVTTSGTHTGTVGNIGSQEKDNSVSDLTQNSGNDVVTTDFGKIISNTHNGTENETVTETSTHSGNIGNIYTQDMFRKELELWNHTFYDIVLGDILDYISLNIY